MTRNKIAGKCMCCFKKYHWIIMFFIMAAGVFLYSRIPAVQADSPVNHSGLSTDFKNFMRGFNQTNLKYMHEAYSAFKKFTENDGWFVAHYNSAEGNTFSTFTKVVREMTTGLAMAIVVIYGLYTLFSEITKGGETDMSLWFRVGASTVVAIYMITAVHPLMNGLYGIGDYVISSVEAIVEDGSPGDIDTEEEEDLMAKKLSQIPGLSGDEAGNNSLEKLLDEENDGNFFAIQEADKMLKYLQYVVYLPMLLSMGLIGTAVFEIRIMQAYAPIAVATIAIDGARSSGVRFLKKYFAVFLKISIYFFIAAVGAELTYFYFGQIKAIKDTSMTPALAIDLTFMLLSNAMAAMAMMQSSGLANEIVGV